MSLDHYFRNLRALHHASELSLVRDGASLTSSSAHERSSSDRRIKNCGPPSVPARISSHESVRQVPKKHTTDQELGKFYNGVAPKNGMFLMSPPKQHRAENHNNNGKNELWAKNKQSPRSTLQKITTGMEESIFGMQPQGPPGDTTPKKVRILSQCLIEAQQIVESDERAIMGATTTTSSKGEERWSSKPLTKTTRKTSV